MARYVTYTNTSSELLFISEEHSLYGSARIGVDGRKDTLYKAGAYNPAWCGTQSARRELGRKQYELTNHLGNVLVSISDKKAYKTLSGSIYFEAEIITLSDYYPFGSAMQTRGFAAGGYRFGFNTQEKDTEIGSDIYTAQFWEYDGRLGRRWNVDPVPQVSISDYAVNGNNPILNRDVLGNEKESIHLDPKGRFICAYNDGDNSIYEHQTAYTKDKVDHWRSYYGVKSGKGVKIGSYNPWYYEMNKSKLLPAQTTMDEVQYFTGAIYNTPSQESGSNTTGYILTAVGTAMTIAENRMYNNETWYSLKKRKTYSQRFNGNQYTGGKLDAKKLSTGLKIGGHALGAYNAVNIELQYSSGKISQFQRITEQGSNVFSTFGGLHGAAWGVGWEMGRAITTIPSYQEWKQNTWLPWRKDNLGY
jgi:RHS repeat-associated protein